jgi:hypothetical protein
MSAGVTRYYFPQVTVETKTVEVQKDVIRNNIVTITSTMKLPNGEVDTTTKTIDNTVHVDTDTKTSQSMQLSPQKNWFVGAEASITGINFANPAYGVFVNRRILGPFYLGGSVNTKGEFGVSVGMEF